MQYASVIPYQKTPRGVDFFDYGIPDDLIGSIVPGSLVKIPLRNTERLGVVASVQDTTVAKKPKNILSQESYSLWASPQRLEFLRWFADYYYVSLPTAFHTLHQLYTKKAFFEMQKETERDVIPEPQCVLIQTEEDREGFLQKTIQAQQGTVLLIEPEEYVAKEREKFFQQHNIPYLSLFGSHSKKIWTAAQEKILANEAVVIIGSRKALFLAMSDTTVIIDDEHEKALKQYDLNPRYRAGVVADFLAQQGHSPIRQLFLVSKTPSVWTWKQVEQGRYTLRDSRTKNLPAVQIVDMNHFTKQGWLSDVAHDALSQNGKVFVFFNRIGFQTIGACQSCGHTTPTTATTCIRCHGTDIRIIRKGTVQLETEIAQAFPGKRIQRIDSTTDLTGVTIDADIIIGTEKVLRVLPLSAFTAVIVLSVDHLLTFPHYQSEERVFQLLVALQDQSRPLIIQTHAPHHPLWSRVIQNDVPGFLTAEYAMRKMLRLPPAQSYWLIRPQHSTDVLKVTERPEIAGIDPQSIIDVVDE